MFQVMFGLFVVLFVCVLASILVGAYRTMSLSGKIFQAVEKQLDEQLAQSQAASDSVRCDHCGTKVGSNEKCPNCGATLA